MRVLRAVAMAATTAILSSPAMAQVHIPLPPAGALPGSPGTGLHGQAWQCGFGLGSIADATACQSGAATLSFLATDVNSPNGSSGRTLADFLAGHATSLSGSSGGDVNQSSWLFSGFLRVNQAGNEVFRVTSDDGFRLRIGGVDVMGYDANRACGPSDAIASFSAAGLYAIELLYWENGGSSCVQLASAPSPNAQFGVVATDRLYPAVPASTVPEPATVALLATGLAGVAGLARRRRRSA